MASGRGIGRLAARLKRRREAAKLSSRTAAAILVITLFVMAVVCWPFVKCHMQAVAVLDLVANQPVPGLLQKIVSEPIETQELTIATSQGDVKARLYVPVKHKDAPALVVLHGVHHLGMNEPRLVAFASAMASCGLRVLTPFGCRGRMAGDPWV